MRNPRLKPDIRLRQAAGFTLVEVLVAMLIIAIGLLGIAALQFRGLQYSNDASLRSNFNLLANDMADRIRINKANSAAYVSNFTAGSAVGACNQATGADAVNDRNCWYTQVNRIMPPGSTANITQAAGLTTVSLSWNDRDGTNRNISYTFQ